MINVIKNIVTSIISIFKKIPFYSVLFILLSCITFSVENFMLTIGNMIKKGSFDLRFSAGDNSHFGQWVLSLMVIMIAPIIFKLLQLLSKKWKLFKNIYFCAIWLALLMFIGEFLVGVVLNLILKLNVWDYSFMELYIGKIKITFHLLGQINIFYLPVWYISALFIYPLFYLIYNIDDKFNFILIDSLKLFFITLFKNKGNLNNDYYDNLINEIIDKDK